MNDTVQIVIVTFVALAALAVLVRPLFARGKTAAPGNDGCGGCAAREPGQAGGTRT